jgi:dephospho-CoA kinase
VKFIGLTGGIASGKSTVSEMIRALGVHVIDADILAREVVIPKTFGWWSVVDHFGQGILNADGEINRPRLAEIIFANKDRRQLLEKITHPLIQWRSQQEKKAYKQQNFSLVFYDAALIFEKKLEHLFDEVVVVNASEQVQAERLALRDKISAQEVELRLKSQIPIAEKVKKSHYVINNEGSVENTKDQVKKLITDLINST